jgi:hypothetical protein
MNARWWLIGVVSALALGGTGCGQLPAASHKEPARSHGRVTVTAATRVRVRIINGIGPVEPGAHITRAARQHAVAAAIRIVSSAILPPGFREVARLPGSNLSEPAQEVACNPIVDATTLWLLRGPAGDLAAYLVDHVPPGMTNDGTGSLTSGGVTTSASVSDIPRGKHPAQQTLIFTFGSVGRAGATGLRVDALAVPSSAVCMSAGGNAVAVPSPSPPARTASR